jgi:hypothetical protein
MPRAINIAQSQLEKLKRKNFLDMLGKREKNKDLYFKTDASEPHTTIPVI